MQASLMIFPRDQSKWAKDIAIYESIVCSADQVPNRAVHVMMLNYVTTMADWPECMDFFGLDLPDSSVRCHGAWGNFLADDRLRHWSDTHLLTGTHNDRRTI